MELTMKNRSFVTMFALSLILASTACQAWNFISSLRAVARNAFSFSFIRHAVKTPNFRFQSPLFRRPSLTLAASAVMPIIAEKNHSTQSRKESLLNCKHLEAMIAAEKKNSPLQPLSGTFSLKVKGFLQCSKKDTDCLHALDSLEHLEKNLPGKQKNKFSLHDELDVTHLDMQVAIKDDKESKYADLHLAAQGAIKCQKGSSCNEKLYVMSKASDDFGTCIKNEFKTGSQPSQKCLSLFNLLGFTTHSPLKNKFHPDSSVQLNDCAVRVTLDPTA